MTNYIKKLLAAVTVFGAVCVTPVLAQECGPLGSEQTFKEDVVKMEEQGVVLITVTPEQSTALLAAGGDPPNTDMSKPYQFYLLRAPSGLGMLFVIQGGCVTITAGPAPIEAFLKRMGLNEASL